MVEHNQNEKMFFVKIDKDLAFIKYDLSDPETMDIYKTYVPESLRGKGLAGQLAQAALDFALRENKKVIPSCSYVDSFMTKNTAYQNLRKSV